MEQTDLFLRFGTALAIGFLIGLQREFAHGGGKREIVAGERTFALMGLVGALAAMSADELSAPLAFIGIILVLGIFSAIAYFIDAWHGQVGLTTEVAMLITVLIGALCYWGFLTLAVAVGISTTVLLSLKLETDRLVRALTREDIMAALQLAVVSAIILPVLPNRAIFVPPFDVLNPFKIWLMVVFITGISFLGYISIKIVGAERGIGITGFLGGLASSTAVTLSLSERSTRQVHLARPLAFAITLAWTMMFPRVLVEVGVVNRALLGDLWLPIIATGATGLIYAVYLFVSQKSLETADVKFTNPFDLVSAIKFGLLYAVVLLVSRAAQMYLGDAGVLISSIASGAADVDAITLTVAELSSSGGLGFETASRAIVLAAISNTIVKGGIALIGGSKELRAVLLPGILIMAIVGIGTAFLL